MGRLVAGDGTAMAVNASQVIALGIVEITAWAKELKRNLDLLLSMPPDNSPYVKEALRFDYAEHIASNWHKAMIRQWQ